MRKILITGGSGFIGTNLISFYENKFEIMNIDIAFPRNTDHKKYWKKVDILDFNYLSKTIAEFSPDIVFHLAARTDLNGKNIAVYNANTVGVENIIKLVNSTKSIKKIIFASSQLVCELGYIPKDEFDYKPTTLYGKSKMLGEQIIRKTLIRPEWIIVRPTSIWGPWFGIPYRNFFNMIQKGFYFHPKNSKIFKQFGYVGNSVYILDKLIDSPFNQRTLYLADFNMLEVGEWANLISNKINNKDVREISLSILKILAIFGDILEKIGYQNPPLTRFRLNNLLTEFHYDTAELSNFVGELPFNLNSGVDRTVQWIKEHG